MLKTKTDKKKMYNYKKKEHFEFYGNNTPINWGMDLINVATSSLC